MILHVITSLESGGAQKVLMEFLSSEIGRGDEAHAVLSLAGHGFYSQRVQSFGAEILSAKSIKDLLRFRKIVCNKNLRVKAWMYHACLVSLFLWPWAKKIVWSIHHGAIHVSDSLSTRIACFVCATLSRFVPSFIIFPSYCCRDAHLVYGFDKRRAIVIYNPVRVSEFSYSKRSREGSGGKMRVGFVGRNHPNKGLRLFVGAAMKFLSEGHQADFLIYGVSSDEFENDLKKQMDIYPGSFILKGVVDDMPLAYRKMDIYTSTSSVESFGLTCIEAYLSGCKVVCARLDVFLELLGSDAIYFNGFEVKNVVDAWLKAMSMSATPSDHLQLLSEKVDSKHVLSQYALYIY